ncbi:hypothetical protein ABNG02_14930 [Halorubrum ejinorense]|uniref:Uncharacterized protein n=1 Tax=Halorubrum ejinorense TaxID=425309 RepID=A0AAV3SQ65_9EURY
MTANATRRPRTRSHPSDGERSFRRAVPMTGTGDGPRPDPTTFAPTSQSERTRGTGRRADSRSTDERRGASNRTANDATTQ